MAKDPFIPFECYCGSLGCYNCRTQAQVNVSAEFFRVFRGYAEPALLSIVPTDAQYTSDELAEFDLNAFVLKHRRRIAACLPVDCIAAGCVDFCLDVFENGEGRWSVHLHLILSRMLTEKEKRVLKAKYPRDPENNVFVPVKQKAIRRGTLSDIVAPYVYKTSSPFVPFISPYLNQGIVTPTGTVSTSHSQHPMLRFWMQHLAGFKSPTR